MRKSTLRIDYSEPTGEHGYPMDTTGYDEILKTDSSFGQQALKFLTEKKGGVRLVKLQNIFTDKNGGHKGEHEAGCNVLQLDSSKEKEFIYDFTRLDRVLDIVIANGLTPFLELGKMPGCISSGQDRDPKNVAYYKPTYYRDWTSLIRAFLQHIHEKYGDQIFDWFYEVWCEPNHPGMWKNSSKDYFELYDHTVQVFQECFPDIQWQLGGPGCGAVDVLHKGEQFLVDFLKHILFEENYATGGKGTYLGFVSLHVMSTQVLRTKTSLYNIKKMLLSLLSVVEFYKETSEEKNGNTLPKDVKVIVTQLQPTGECDKGVSEIRYLKFRNTAYYAAFLGWISALLEDFRVYYGIPIYKAFANHFHFDKEAKKPFHGSRSLITFFPLENNGAAKSLQIVPKPAFHTHQFLQALKSEALKVSGEGYIWRRKLVCIPTRDPNADTPHLAVFLSYFQRYVWFARKAQVEIQIENLPEKMAGKEFEIKEYRIDKNHMNTYEVWKELGQPEVLTKKQLYRLQSVGEFRPIKEERVTLNPETNNLHYKVLCTPYSVILLSIRGLD